MTDREILDLFHDDSTKELGFRMLLEKYQQRLYYCIRRMVHSHEDADDIMQNIAIKVWKGLANFRSDAQLFTWLYRIATNETITFLNKNKKHQSVALIQGDDDTNDSYDLSNTLKADDYFDGDEIQRKLETAISLLPDKQKLVFNLRYYDELKYEKMSEILGTSVGALKASYHHAVKKIEESLRNN